MCSGLLFSSSFSVFIEEALSTTSSIIRGNKISPRLYKAVAGFLLKWECGLHVFSTWGGLVPGWQCAARIGIVSINAGRWNANTIKSVWPIQQFSAQMPISLLLIICLMRNHSAGKSPNLCKHTVSIDLSGRDMSSLRLARRLHLSRFHKGWPGPGRELSGASEAVTTITMEISYWAQVMRTDRLEDGSISGFKPRKERQIVTCLLFVTFKVAFETSGPVRVCV